jgi:hypothetical protein
VPLGEVILGEVILGELILGVVWHSLHNAFEPTLKINTVLNIRPAATESPKRSYLTLAKHWSYDHYNPRIKQTLA